MRLNKVKTRRGKRFLENKAPKLEENDKKTLILRGGKTTEIVGQALHGLYLLKKPLADKLSKKMQIHPFEDETMLCKLSQKFDSSLFAFGSNSKKRPNSLIFGRMYDHQMLDMVEMQMEKFVSSTEFKDTGVVVGAKPCILLQGTLFEADETFKRIGNLMVDWFRGAKVSMVRLQGLELVIAFTAVSEQQLLFRVYRTILKKSKDTNIPEVELVEIGPQIDFKLNRNKLAGDDLYKTALKKPKPAIRKAGKKNVKFDAFGSKVAKIHTGRQQVEKIQTRKTKVFKNSNRV